MNIEYVYNKLGKKLNNLENLTTKEELSIFAEEENIFDDEILYNEIVKEILK